jgi:hypothetical protein
MKFIQQLSTFPRVPPTTSLSLNITQPFVNPKLIVAPKVVKAILAKSMLMPPSKLFGRLIKYGPKENMLNFKDIFLKAFLHCLLKQPNYLTRKC